MFQRSCCLIKSVSPPTACQADALGCSIMGLFNGCSRRKLHNLMQNLIKIEYKVGSHRYGHLHKLCICPKRELICTAVQCHEKTSDQKSVEPVDKGKENAPKKDSQSSYQHLSNSNEEGLIQDTCESVGFSSVMTHSQNMLTSPVMPKSGDDKGILNVSTIYTDKSTAAASENSLNHGDHVKSVQEVVIDRNRNSSSAYAGIGEDNPQYQSLTSSAGGGREPGDSLGLVKTANDVKMQKAHAPAQPKKRQSVDLNRCSTERNFITPVRAMTDFLLKPTDLEGLRKTKRRSPYENDPPITVYWRKDVEAKAIDVWGSKENLLKEILKRDIERRRYQQNIFTVKRRLRDYRREQGRETEFNSEQNGLTGSTGRVVLTAIFINGGNFLFKFVAWWYTGSHSMFSEALHSLADTVNQLILAYGIYKSVQRADSDHPYGYTNMKYVSSLISGVAIFCLGSGLSFYHGVIGLTDPSPVDSYYWAFLVLAGSFASEGATLLLALNSVVKGARAAQMKVAEYILRGNDPSVNVILLEDAAAVLGVLVAGCSMGLSAVYKSHIPDAVGSLLVGGLLAGVATFIIYTNVAALVGRSIPQERLDRINAELESDVMIRAIHDVKGIDMGNNLVRYKAEMDFDGGELTRSYLDKQDLNQMLEEVKKFQTIDELEEFMLKHGENIVDMMGGEIDRIELKLRKKHPEIRHCDLEIL
ncbi:UNVERIFIED_CONTAM: hypothetical protein PYX00_010790 [Menopon gallinae]|uniref:Proton-coupled zinc antiporter SLC30A9, mitochondrial n=1 Tax=Menopon gallinae TaxID=328185 RepID=A0AAW2HH89_9NEOP